MVRLQDAPQEYSAQEEAQFRADLARQIDESAGAGTNTVTNTITNTTTVERLIVVEDEFGTTSQDAEKIKLDPTFSSEPDASEATTARLTYGPASEVTGVSGNFTLDATGGPRQTIRLSGDAILTGVSNLTAPLQVLIERNEYMLDIDRSFITQFGLDLSAMSRYVAISFLQFAPGVIVAAAFPAGLGGTIGLGGEWGDTMSIAAARQAVADVLGGAFADTMSIAASRQAFAGVLGGAWSDTLAIEATRQARVDGPLSFSDTLRVEAARAVASNVSMRPFTDAFMVEAARAADVEGEPTEECFTLNPPAVFNTSGSRWYWSNIEQTSDNLVPSEYVAGGGVAYLYALIIRQTGQLELQLSTNAGSGGSAGPDLVQALRDRGTLRVSVPSVTDLLVTGGIGGDDENEPYVWTPDNSAEVTAFYNAAVAAGSSVATLQFCLPPAVETPVEQRALSDAMQIAAGRMTTLDAMNMFTDALQVAAGRLIASNLSAQTFADALQVEAARSTATASSTCVPDQTDEVARFTVTAGADVVWFQDSDIGTASGSATGDRVVAVSGSTDLSIDRVWWVDRGDGTYDLRLNRAPLGVAYGNNADFNVYFGGDGAGKAVYVCVGGSDFIEIPVHQRRSIGPHYLNLTPTDAQATYLNAVSAGDEVEIVIGDATPVIENQAFSDTLALAAARAAISTAQLILPDQSYTLNPGSSASAIFTPTGGQGPYTFEIQSGGPSWVTEHTSQTAGSYHLIVFPPDGIAAGVYTTMVRVTDSLGFTTVALLTTTVEVIPVQTFSDTLEVSATRGVASNLSTRPFSDAMQVAATRGTSVESPPVSDFVHTVGRATREGSTFAVWNYTDLESSPVLPGDFFEVAGNDGFIRRVRVEVRTSDDGDSAEFQFRITHTGLDDLREEIESSDLFFHLRAGGETLSVPGPSHSSMELQDTSEPYLFRSFVLLDDLTAWLAHYNSLSSSQRANTQLRVYYS